MTKIVSRHSRRILMNYVFVGLASLATLVAVVEALVAGACGTGAGQAQGQDVQSRVQ